MAGDAGFANLANQAFALAHCLLLFWMLMSMGLLRNWRGFYRPFEPKSKIDHPMSIHRLN